MYKLINDDCLNVFKDIPDKSIDLIITDPPYRIVSGGCTNKGNMATTGVFSEYKKEVRQGKIFKHNDIQFKEWLPDLFRVLKNESHCYIMINDRNIAELQKECEKVGFTYQNLLIWDKGNVTPNKWYMKQCEFILMLRKGKCKNINNMGTSTLINIPNIVGKKVHPTQKPVELISMLVENSSNKGDTILDCFMGSGTTGVACRKLNRNFIGIEIDKKFYNIANERIKNN